MHPPDSNFVSNTYKARRTKYRDSDESDGKQLQSALTQFSQLFVQVA